MLSNLITPVNLEDNKDKSKSKNLDITKNSLNSRSRIHDHSYHDGDNGKPGPKFGSLQAFI
jgi:hypothetical protein